MNTGRGKHFMFSGLLQARLGYSVVSGFLISGALFWLALPGLASREKSQSGQDMIAQATTVKRPVLKFGSQGKDVSELQSTLKLLGYYKGAIDGIYSEGTVAAVSLFQRDTGLNVDGIVGSSTWNRLLPPSPNVSPVAAPAATPTKPTTTSRPASSPKPTAPPTITSSNQADLPLLKMGMRGSAVAGLQRRLKATGFYNGIVDGVFGTGTQTAVRAAQRKFKLEPDGVVGLATWTALLQ